MKAKRILAALGAVWILGSLAAPASAKQVNTETKEQEKHYGDTYVGDPDWGEPIGHLGEGDAFWSEQPFDSYWTDRGRSNYAGHDRSGMWLMTNYYYSGEGHTVAVDDPRFKAASYLGIRTVLGCRVFTENEWNLEKVSEKTEDYVNELVYVGEVYTGDTIETICTDYNIGTAFAINRYDNYQAANNDPARPAEAIIAPTEYSCFNSNVRAVQHNGEMIDGAEDFVWEPNAKADANGEIFTGDAAMCGWIYTVQPGDELIYADCQARLLYQNEYKGIKIDEVTFRYRFIFVVMDSGADVVLPGGVIVVDPQEPTPGGEPSDSGDGENWWDTLFGGGGEEDTGSAGDLPPDPPKPQQRWEEGGDLPERTAGIIGTAAGAAIIGAAIGAMTSGGGTPAPAETGQTEVPTRNGNDPRAEEERIRQKEAARQEAVRRQAELERQAEIARQEAERAAELARLQEEYRKTLEEMAKKAAELLEEARKQAEQKKKYIDKLYTKYGVDPNQPNAYKVLRNTIKKEQIKNANEAAAELARDAELAVWERLATDISSGADISMELAASVTGETGKTVLAAYYTLKGTASRTAEAIARIAYNGKSYGDYSLRDYAGDAWDIAHSAVQGTAEGAVKGVQSFVDYNDPVGAKWKAGLQVGGEAAKEMWDTARKGGDFVDIMKAGARGTTKGAVNATISYVLDKTIGKLGGKGTEFNTSRISNYGGATGTIANKITSGDLVSGGANTAVSMITEKTGMNDAIDGLFGSPTAHADAAAQAAKKIADAAKGMK